MCILGFMRVNGPCVLLLMPKPRQTTLGHKKIDF